TRSLPAPLWGGVGGLRPPFLAAKNADAKHRLCAEAQRRRAGWGWCDDARTSPHNIDPHPQPLPNRSRGYPTSASFKCRTRASAGSVGRGAERVRGDLVRQIERNKREWLTAVSPRTSSTSPARCARPAFRSGRERCWTRLPRLPRRGSARAKISIGPC